MAHDLLVALLNLDAEIKYRLARLTQLDCQTDEPVTPWRQEARADLLGELALLQARREECFLKLNGVRREPSSGSPPRADPLPERTGTSTGSYPRSDPPTLDASPVAFEGHVLASRYGGVRVRAHAALEKGVGSPSRPR
ncbi:hypothetical protein [Paraburkholderia mimosarum]|uniref:hypothetical protein n=1 Tax=Paraburkholderia mimosarum TaxID=312026 RepID=UPI0012DEFA8F|nr:hypothetical protein [Paraburkholderia mimosarum]